MVRELARQLLGQASQVDLVDTLWGPRYNLRARVLFHGRDSGRERARGPARPVGGSDGGESDWCE
ncbi:MAG: hypothetical protein IIA41_08905 [SAR324 cluster bacterium]|nr:hypothetical protein [SAR324 cluster bacterium]